MLIVRFYYPEVINSIERVNVKNLTFGKNVPIMDRNLCEEINRTPHMTHALLFRV